MWIIPTIKQLFRNIITREKLKKLFKNEKWPQAKEGSSVVKFILRGFHE